MGERKEAELVVPSRNFGDTLNRRHAEKPLMPPASSEGLTIFVPLESRLRLRCNIAFDEARLFEATVAA